MKHVNRNVRHAVLVAMTFLLIAAFVPLVYAQNAALGQAGKSVTPLLQKMVGTWHVQPRMWTRPDSKSIELPSAVANRHLVAGAFLEQVMQRAESGQGGFTRIAYVNYNPTTHRYEYFSLDTRAPQQMRYRSPRRDRSQTGPVHLQGGVFIAPKWGPATHVAFKYRLVIGEVHDDKQVARLYLTPQDGQDQQEFLAFEYIYTRQ